MDDVTISVFVADLVTQVLYGTLCFIVDDTLSCGIFDHVCTGKKQYHLDAYMEEYNLLKSSLMFLIDLYWLVVQIAECTVDFSYT